MTRGNHASAPDYQWSRIAATDLEWWNRRLLDSDAMIFQFPYFVQSWTQPAFFPIYISCGPAHQPLAYACVRAIGGASFKIGLVFRGPVLLAASCDRELVLAGLHAWARREGFLFLRFSHWDAELLDAVTATAATVEPVDAFPFLKDWDSELIVPLVGGTAQRLAAFQPIARRNLSAATATGYQIRVGTCVDDLAAVLPLFRKLGVRKTVRLGSETRFLALTRLAATLGCARIYGAFLDGEPVQFILVMRSGKTAEYWMGAIDLEALGDRASPGVMLHWRAMQDFAALGCHSYNLGTRSGSVHRFKLKFRPIERSITCVTVILEPCRYRLWRWLALSLAAPWWPKIRPWARSLLRR